jgi:hypothetical protein
MFLSHGHNLKTKSSSTLTPKVEWMRKFSIIRELYWIKKSRSEIFTPKQKCMGSIWKVLAGKKKSPNKSKLWFLLKLFWRWSCLPNIGSRRFPYNSNFLHYFSKIIDECLHLKRGMPSTSRVLSSLPWKPILKQKKIFGKNFTVLNHSEKFNFTRIILCFLFSHFGPKLCKVWMKNVFKTTINFPLFMNH